MYTIVIQVTWKLLSIGEIKNTSWSSGHDRWQPFLLCQNISLCKYIGLTVA